MITYTCVANFHNNFLALLSGIVLFFLILIPNNSRFTLYFYFSYLFFVFGSFSGVIGSLCDALEVMN